jgi:four helix bundle suffix protein
MPHHPQRLRPSGGYRKLRSFQTATLIYDGTVSFCKRFVDPRSRTNDQMVQAARSGRQNIAEASRAGATSSTSETHLTNVARASLDELLLDYEDFLRQRHLPLWAKDAPEAQKVRKLGPRSPDPSDPAGASPYTPWLEHPDPGVVANALICLIHQANYLLDRQIAVLERAIIEKGGYREQLTAARLAERGKEGSINRTVEAYQTDRTDRTGRTETTSPLCPRCGKPMKRRTARRGQNPGASFWGCADYPNCGGTRPLQAAGKSSDPSAPSDPSDKPNPSD